MVAWLRHILVVAGGAVGAANAASAAPEPAFRIPLEGHSTWSVNEDGGVSNTFTFTANLTVGTPPQTFSVLVDTGSSNLWLPLDRCTERSCLRHTRYRPHHSNSSRLGANSEKRQITTFATGQLMGMPILDVVCFQGAAEGSGTCVDMEFLAAEEETAYPFADMPFDGILGLGPKTAATAYGSSAVLKLREQHGLRFMSVHLSGDRSGDRGSGEVSFSRGMVAGVGPWHWAPMHPASLESAHWMVRLLSIRVDDKILVSYAPGFGVGGGSGSGCRAVLDTGAPSMLGPEGPINELLQILSASTTCNGFEERDMPTVWFEIEGSDGPMLLNLEPKDYAVRDRCNLEFNPCPACQGNGEMWVLGQPVLRRYDTVYDGEDQRIAFSNRISPLPQGAPAPTARYLRAPDPAPAGRAQRSRRLVPHTVGGAALLATRLTSPAAKYLPKH